MTRVASSRSGSIRTRACSAAFAVVLALFAVAARADQLPRLHVTAFSLSADTAHPIAEQPFRLIIDLRVTQRITSLYGVVLPMFGPLEILGDEKQVLAGGGGTEYRETISVVSHQSGATSIAPAYLDAIDARDGKPKRFLSNSLTLRVGGAAAASLAPLLRTLAEIAAGIVVVLLMALGVLRFRRPSRVVVPPAEEAQPAPPAAPTPSDEPPYATALADLQAEPSRACARRVRERIWQTMGASRFDTLADVLRRPAAHDAAVRGVLRALERAAFTHDADLRPALDDAIAVLARITQT